MAAQDVQEVHVMDGHLDMRWLQAVTTMETRLVTRMAWDLVDETEAVLWAVADGMIPMAVALSRHAVPRLEAVLDAIVRDVDPRGVDE
jgi:hypothetical protein